MFMSSDCSMLLRWEKFSVLFSAFHVVHRDIRILFYTDVATIARAVHEILCGVVL
jgi:hypothetical protein